MEKVTRNNNLVRVVLTGSESTGKTVLATQLADHYNAELAPEFVRDFARQRSNVIGLADTEEIARGQIALEDEHAQNALRSRSASALLILDTDLLSTAVYSEHYYGQCMPWIAESAQQRRPDLYLLLEIDVPWVPDDVRDRETRREEMQQLFRDAVKRSGAPSAVISGSWAERLRLARTAIDNVLASR